MRHYDDDLPTPMPMTDYDDHIDNQLRRCTDKPMNNYNDNDIHRHTISTMSDDDTGE